ncbi:MAG: KUP/HAK/KT family potassium transporter, partial [Spartobacteria bacterium]
MNSAATIKNKSGAAGMALLALGVVFGDIGTSPLYAYQIAVALAGAGSAVGVASLVVWTLFLVVWVKYVMLVMRADYHGEGGIFALMARIFDGRPRGRASRGWLACLLVFGAALLFGDGAITPAVSVLSAVEGLASVNAEWEQYALPLAVGILGVFFFVQRFGTSRLGGIFGPVMLVWFLVLAVTGAVQIAACPEVLQALNPWHGVRLLASGGWGAWALVGAVVLAVTGAEALYADLGHFGRNPIISAWRFIVFPALALNYLGQAALVTKYPAAAVDTNLFFLMVPAGHWRMVLVVLATAATIIASQALISGVFSLASQAMDLGYLPRLFVRHTSAETRGQIYIPVLNTLFGIACIMLVLGFRTADALAGAYGIAVTGAMAVTSVAYFVVKRAEPSAGVVWPVLVFAGLLCLDLPLLGACLSKIADGGVVPLGLAVAVAAVMLVWRKGRELVHGHLLANPLELGALAARMEAEKFPRVAGTQVYVMRQIDPEFAVARILEQYRRARVLPENVVVLLLDAGWGNPFAAAENVTIKKHPAGLWEASARHGYMNEPDVPLILQKCAEQAGEDLLKPPVFHILAQEMIVTCTNKQMRRWQKTLFGFLSRNVLPGPDYLNIPADSLIVYNWLLRLEPAEDSS